MCGRALLPLQPAMRPCAPGEVMLAIGRGLVGTFLFCHYIEEIAGGHLGSLFDIGRGPGLSPSLLIDLSVGTVIYRPDMLNWLASVNQEGEGHGSRPLWPCKSPVG